MAMHTPGSWSWKFSDDSRLPELVSSSGKTICNFGDDEQYYPSCGQEPSPADMTLIEAAPDLLAACQLWDQGLADCDEWDFDQFLVWLNANRDVARNAIAKATGEVPRE